MVNSIYPLKEETINYTPRATMTYSSEYHWSGIFSLWTKPITCPFVVFFFFFLSKKTFPISFCTSLFCFSFGVLSWKCWLHWATKIETYLMVQHSKAFLQATMRNMIVSLERNLWSSDLNPKIWEQNKAKIEY